MAHQRGRNVYGRGVRTAAHPVIPHGYAVAVLANEINEGLVLRYKNMLVITSCLY